MRAAQGGGNGQGVNDVAHGAEANDEDAFH
jgi:hypothetical protein